MIRANMATVGIDSVESTTTSYSALQSFTVNVSEGDLVVITCGNNLFSTTNVTCADLELLDATSASDSPSDGTWLYRATTTGSITITVDQVLRGAVVVLH